MKNDTEDTANVTFSAVKINDELVYESAENSSGNEKTAVLPVIPQDEESGAEEETTRVSPQEGSDSQEHTYILNTNTRRFHYSWCDSVNEIKEKNKDTFIGDRQTVINMGYKSCGRCKP